MATLASPLPLPVKVQLKRCQSPVAVPGWMLSLVPS